VGNEHRQQPDENQLCRRHEEQSEDQGYRFEVNRPRLASEDEMEGNGEVQYECRDGLFATYEQGDDALGENDNVAERQNGECASHG